VQGTATSAVGTPAPVAAPAEGTPGRTRGATASRAPGAGGDATAARLTLDDRSLTARGGWRRLDIITPPGR
jgi:hypothetical protein